MTRRRGILFCMRYADDEGFVWRTVVKVRDRVAGLLTDYDCHVAFPQLTGNSAHAIANMRPVELDAYTLAPADKAKLRAFVDQHDIAAIVYMSALPTMLDMAFLHSLGVKTINTEQDSFDHRIRDSFVRRAAKFVVRRGLKRQLHDLHIANSHSQRDWLQDYALIPPARLTVAANGVDCDHFTPAERRETRDRLEVICAGQARSEKRVDMILRVAARIFAQPEFDHVRFTYVGAGPMLEEWQRLARELGIADRVHFAGHQSDLLPFYREADLMVHAAERESFGLVLAEAMACGLPVVASAAAGPSEIVADGETGRLIALDDEDGFVEAVEAYLRDPALIARHGAAARARAVDRFSMERQVRDMAAAIAGALRT
ncbi:glycosyltransferase [Alteriqipengyuania lutimaris]|uniref:Glycosyltransferase family 1 protein n=1 Tax=Alteriqipengyuania lutimaris TaxID=1538146 RepID=A0A395LS25_9SPHN|nr:glycosyltransferase [Alteriqipengyuania lutimaris]MBB3033624.1 glycosyltransferase involved in cell wall biosynthesis [Alteriqipengyuania lutimaris]RDS77380.1 glycosyltransferase family 1 protein [Alteriqipengyuania lutimaris]